MANFERDANLAASIIEALLSNGVKLQQLELVGFAMGAQIAGWAARKITHVKIPTIIALGASIIPDVPILTINDANFVMTVRTEYRFSDPNVKGHLNFFVNKDLTLSQCYFLKFGFCEFHAFFK